MPGREEALERARAAAAKTRSEFREVGGQLVSPYPVPRGRGRRVRQQGPVSNLLTENPPELYSSAFSVDTDDPSRTPFGREFDFTDEGSRELPRGYTPGESGTIADRSKRFIDQYFGGVDSEVLNPATGKAYGKELKVHDALHDYMNVSNTLRGEELVTVGEKIANEPLSSNRIGLSGLTQQGFYYDNDPDDIARFGEDIRKGNTRMTGPTLVQQRGATRGSSLFRDQNNPASFLSPPITEREFGEVTRRAREFYDQVHAGWNQFKRSGDYSFADKTEVGPPRFGTGPITGIYDSYGGGALRDASKQFIEGPLQGMPIEGGYRDPGGMPFGPKEQLMNPPLVPVGDANEYDKSVRRQIEPIAKRMAGVAMADYERLSAPEQVELRKQEGRWMDQASDMKNWWLNDHDPWEDDLTTVGLLTPEGNKPAPAAPEIDPAQQNYANSLIEQGVERGRLPRDDQHEMAARAALGSPPEPLQADPRIMRYLFPDDLIRVGRYRFPSIGKDFASLVKPDANLWKNIAMSEEITMDGMRGLHRGGIRSAAFTGKASEAFPGGSIFLNPPNLGGNTVRQRTGPLQDRTRADNAVSELRGVNNKEVEQILLNAAVDAKDKFRVKSAIRAGFGAATDTIGSVPLLDPGFRAAVNKGDAGGAGVALATDLVAGAAAAPVMGAGAGVLQRAAPRVAARALPAIAGVSRLGNPVAVVSQLGGDRQLTKAQEVADRQAGEAQQNRARLAQQRGGRISFPTPFGKVRLPDLGVSESGGLVFGGNSSGRRIGARSVLGGKPVVWTGDSYGWQSPGAAAKVGVR